MADRKPLQIINEAEDLLRTADFGLEDMEMRPGRAKSGLRNAVIFGRNATFALQNLRSICPDFDAWYKEKQQAMRDDPLMRYFHELRNSIEKQARTPTSVSAYIRSFSTADMVRFQPAPPGATAFVIGDQAGGSGWIVEKPGGTRETYYVDLPPDIGKVDLHLSDVPAEIAQGRTALQLAQEYINRVRSVVSEARERFVTT